MAIHPQRELYQYENEYIFVSLYNITKHAQINSFKILTPSRARGVCRMDASASLSLLTSEEDESDLLT
jgi:hypothetical protein